MSDADKLKLRIYCQEITRAPRYLEEQPYQKTGTFLWCEDWEIIEMLKYLFHGKELYDGDPLPNRLKNNPLYHREEIQQRADKMMEEFKTVDALTAEFRRVRNASQGVTRD